MKRAAFLLLVSAFVGPAQDFPEFRTEKLSTDYKFTEGPVWSREGFLLFADIPADKVIKLGRQPASAFFARTRAERTGWSSTKRDASTPARSTRDGSPAPTRRESSKYSRSALKASG